MTRDAVIELIENLAASQGSYGRLLRFLEDLSEVDREKYEEIMHGLEECETPLDVVMAIEG